MEPKQELEALEDTITVEKRRAAREMQSEIWNDGMLEGIETDILADAAMATALEEIVGENGEDAAMAVIEEMRERLVAGEFTRLRTLQ